VQTTAATATTTAPTQPREEPTQQGVTPGAFCSPRGAFGVTSTGKLMLCGPSATDSKNRWRAA